MPLTIIHEMSHYGSIGHGWEFKKSMRTVITAWPEIRREVLVSSVTKDQAYTLGMKHQNCKRKLKRLEPSTIGG